VIQHVEALEGEQSTPLQVELLVVIEGHVDQLTAVHQAQVVSTAGQGDRVAREGVEGDEQPDLCAARSQSPHELLHVGPADRVERPLALDLGDRWLQAQRIPVGDDAAVAVGGVTSAR